jgi:hypothetical protein
MFVTSNVRRFTDASVARGICGPTRYRRATDSRATLWLSAGLLAWLLSAFLFVAAQAQTTSDVVTSADTPWSVPGTRMAGSAQASEPRTIEIYEQYGTYTLDAPPSEMHPIVLSIPEQFLYGSSKEASRNWGVNILTYYPSFTSPQDPANAAFGLKCTGICNGQILVSVANRKHSISLDFPNMGDFIAHTEFKWSKTPPYPSNVQVRDIEPPPGFDEAFERVTSATPSPTGDKHQAPALTKRTYLRKADSGHYDLAAICNVNQIKTSCILHFSLNCNPAIYVSVNGVDGSYLPMATDIKDKADRFISAMIKKPSCTY